MLKIATIKQYQGFINTPNLWNGASVFDLEQFEIPNNHHYISNSKVFNEIRLGKRVEQFLDFQIQNSPDFELIKTNIQIKNQKITIGELDMLLKDNNQYTHLEIVYKFYLYDSNINSENTLDKWIGPNRKDTLIYKLNKLKKKQLPLLYSEHCKPILESLKLNNKNIQQKVCYKAQLFVPFNNKGIVTSPLNSNCIYGFYMSFSDIETLNGNQFYIPDKLDWLIEPNENVSWMNFEMAVTEISNYINEYRSPMVWIKSRTHKLKKCFITFW